MSINQAISAQDSALYVKAGTAPTAPNNPAGYTEIDGLTAFPFGRGQAVQVSGHRWPVGSSAGQEILRDADPDADLHFLMVLPTGDAATFVAKVAAFNVAPGTNQVLTFTADLLPREFALVTVAAGGTP